MRWHIDQKLGRQMPTVTVIRILGFYNMNYFYNFVFISYTNLLTVIIYKNINAFFPFGVILQSIPFAIKIECYTFYGHN